MEGTDVAIMATEEKAVAERTFDMARADGLGSLKQAETVVSYMASKCSGPSFISRIQGKQYPLVTWWTTVGAALGLFPQEVSSRKIKDDPLTYEAVVEVRHGEQVVSRASAICSAEERRWKTADEYAVKSMATTRATGKAYRIAFAFLAVMAGLEPTPAEEIPAEEHEQKAAEQAKSEYKGFGKNSWKSKYAGTCQRCGAAVEVGDTVHYYYPGDGSKRVEHLSCAEMDAQILDANTVPVNDPALNAAFEQTATK